MSNESAFASGARAATRRELQEAQAKYRLVMQKPTAVARPSDAAAIARFVRSEDLEAEWPTAAARIVELQIDRCDDVRPLARLGELPALATLRLGGLGFISNLEWLPTMPRLRAMRLQGFGQGLTSLAGIAATPALEALVLDPLDERAIVQSLDPLAVLTELRLLVLPGVSSVDLSLRAVAQLQKLELFHGTAYFGPYEYEMLATTIPGLRCPWFSDLAWQML